MERSANGGLEAEGRGRRPDAKHGSDPEGHPEGRSEGHPEGRRGERRRDGQRLHMFRGLVSLLAGFLVLPLLMLVALEVVQATWPGVGAPGGDLAGPRESFLTLNLGLAAAMAGVSAAITARLAPEPRYLWVLLLAFVVFAGGLVFGIQLTGGVTPTWYLLGLPLVSGLAIAAGGWAYLMWDERRARE